MNERKAIVLGATGLIGRELVSLLLADPFYNEIEIHGRTALGIEHPKLNEFTGDLLEEHYFNGRMQAYSIFCCIGTTQSKTPDLAIYKKIDYGIPLQAAKAGAADGARQFLVVSSMGANADSRVFYNRIKGQMEEAVRASGVPEVYIFRPSLLLGKREEFRLMEKLGKGLFKAFGWLLPSRYKGVYGEQVARAMLKVAKEHPDQQVFPSDQIRRMTS